MVMGSYFVSLLPLRVSLWLGNGGNHYFAPLAMILLPITFGLVCVMWLLLRILLWPLQRLLKVLGRYVAYSPDRSLTLLSGRTPQPERRHCNSKTKNRDIVHGADLLGHLHSGPLASGISRLLADPLLYLRVVSREPPVAYILRGDGSRAAHRDAWSRRKSRTRSRCRAQAYNTPATLP